MQRSAGDILASTSWSSRCSRPSEVWSRWMSGERSDSKGRGVTQNLEVEGLFIIYLKTVPI